MLMLSPFIFLLIISLTSTQTSEPKNDKQINVTSEPLKEDRNDTILENVPNRDYDCAKYDKLKRSLKVEEVHYDDSPIGTAACEVELPESFDTRAEFNLSTEDTLLFRKIYPVWQPIPITSKGSDKPLILTEYLKSGRIGEGRRLARVNHPEITPLVKTSYSGYLTVDEKYNSNLFFWFFPAQNDNTIPCLRKEKSNTDEKPLILWLQGGPGASSMFGLFHEIGPLAFDKNKKLILNNVTWNRDYNLLFIDNPVGTGFSFTDHQDGYNTKQEEIGKNLYKAMIQFYELFYEYQGSPFYIAGESYAGKHVPSLAWEIMNNNPEAETFINLQGMAIGNGLTDPENMIEYSNILIKQGLIDQESYHLMQIIEKQAKYNIKLGKYLPAFMDLTKLLKVFFKSSGYKKMYHLMEERKNDGLDLFSSFVQRSSVRKALHVGDTEFTSIGQVYKSLIPDIMRSIKPQVDELLKHYRIMFYSGQLDLIVAYPLTHEGMFKDVAWGTRKVLRVDDRIAGYSQSSGNLTLVMVRNAGHMVPTDQPEWALNIIQSFIDKKYKHTRL